jgi:hypothetical protein
MQRHFIGRTNFSVDAAIQSRNQEISMRYNSDHAVLLRAKAIAANCAKADTLALLVLSISRDVKASKPVRDDTIASVLNARGILTRRGHTWTRRAVRKTLARAARIKGRRKQSALKTSRAAAPS